MWDLDVWTVSMEILPRKTLMFLMVIVSLDDNTVMQMAWQALRRISCRSSLWFGCSPFSMFSAAYFLTGAYLSFAWLRPNLYTLLSAWCFAIKGTIDLQRTYKRPSGRIDAWILLWAACQLYLITVMFLHLWLSLCLSCCFKLLRGDTTNLMRTNHIKRIKSISLCDTGNNCLAV